MRRRVMVVAATLLAGSISGVAVAPGGASAQAASPLANPAVGIAPTRAGDGYFIARANGEVRAFFRSGVTPPDIANTLPSLRLNAPITGIAVTPSGRGYWLAAADGGVFAFGDAQFYGSMGGVRLNAPVVEIVATPSGRGYYLAASDGGVFAFGDAVFRGSTGSLVLNSPITDFALLPNGAGYYLLGADGGIFAFNATFRGSRGNVTIEGGSPYTTLHVTAAGAGYRLFEADGPVFNFGTAPLQDRPGSTLVIPLFPQFPLVDSAANVTSGSVNGYYALDAAGGVFAVGVPFYGSAA